MATDQLARGLAARTFASLRSNSSIGVFIATSQVNIPSGTARVSTTGYASAGVGEATYIADGLADAALFAAHPRFVFQAADGRYFRLLVSDGAVFVEQGGAAGQETAILNEAVPSAPVVIGAPLDNRAAIQATITYANANGIGTVKFASRFYALRRKTYTGVGYPAGLTYLDAALLRSTKSITLESVHPTGTTLVRLKANGAATNLADKEDAGGYAIRGGGFTTDGLPVSGGNVDPALQSFTMRNVVMDGGLRKSMGLSFEILDKGLWQQNDSHCGHATFEGRSGFIGFTSELVYLSGSGTTELAKRHLTIGPDCVFGETGGSCLNPNGQTLAVGRAFCYNAYIGMEGWTGNAGGYLNAIFQDCTQSTLQGGAVNQDGGLGGYYFPREGAVGVLPIGTIDIVTIRSPFSFGAWISGSVTAIDTQHQASDSAAFASGTNNCNLDIKSFVHGSSAVSAINIGGANCHDNFFRVSCHRTDVAIAAGRKHTYSVTSYGNIPGDNTVEIGATYEEMAGISPGGGSGKAIKFTGNYYGLNSGQAINFEALSGGNFNFSGAPPRINLTATSAVSHSFTVGLPSSGLVKGTRFILFNATSDVALRIPGGQFFSRSGDLILGPPYAEMEVEYVGSYLWKLLSAPSPFGKSVAWNPGSIASGAQESVTVSNVWGVKKGDPVRASFDQDLAGLILTAYVSADDTIKAVLANLTGATVDLAAGTLRVEVGGL